MDEAASTDARTDELDPTNHTRVVNRSITEYSAA